MKQNNKYIIIGLLAIGGYLLYRKYMKNSSTQPDSNVNFLGLNIPPILNDWKDNFDNKRLDEITNNYAPDGILVSTFGDILKGRKKIKDYFKGLFEKDKLSVDYLGTPDVKDLKDVKVYTGLYQFNYLENGKMNHVKSRYSFISKEIDGKTYILKQHSSVAN